MLSGVQSLLVMLFVVAASVCLLSLVRRVWSSEARRQHNDLIGWHLSVIGSTYAVIIGFMLFAVWTNYKTAESNAEAEANCLVNMARSARGLPSIQRDKIVTLATDYANLMITEEWPDMSVERLSHSSQVAVRAIWATLSSTEVRSGLEQTSLDHALSELARMTEYRRLRMLQVTSYLPSILWLVLVLGATVTILSACLFGAADFRVHLVQVIMLSLIISSLLVAIADINQPFQGSVHVDPTAFQQALQTLREMP